jgi:hypothetical protein
MKKVRVFVVDPCGSEHWLQVPQGMGAIDIYEVDEKLVNKYEDLLEFYEKELKGKGGKIETLAGYVVVVLEAHERHRLVGHSLPHMRGRIRHPKRFFQVAERRKVHQLDVSSLPAVLGKRGSSEGLLHVVEEARGEGPEAARSNRRQTPVIWRKVFPLP